MVERKKTIRANKNEKLNLVLEYLTDKDDSLKLNLQTMYLPWAKSIDDPEIKKLVLDAIAFHQGEITKLVNYFDIDLKSQNSNVVSFPHYAQPQHSLVVTTSENVSVKDDLVEEEEDDEEEDDDWDDEEWEAELERKSNMNKMFGL